MNTSANSDSTPAKRGRSCGGCLCDMRRALIILSGMGSLLSVLSLVSNYFLLYEPTKDDIGERTDDTSAADDMQRLDDLFLIQIVASVLSILGFALSIRGAMTFSVRLVIPNAIYMPLGFALLNISIFRAAGDIEEFDYSSGNLIGPLIGVVMSVYVHVSFIKEVRAGIMSPENYANEEQSCCCV
jgi:hypothetical protein